jgi:hypothetical protein
MTDERAEVRAVLDAVSSQPPPTRLGVDEICAAARRTRSPRSRLRAGTAAWLRRLAVPLPSVRLIAGVAAIVAVAALLPGLVVLGLLTAGDSNTASNGGGGGSGAGGGGGPQYRAPASAPSAARSPTAVAAAPAGAKVAKVTYLPAGYQPAGYQPDGYQPDGDCRPPSTTAAGAAAQPAVASCTSLYWAQLPGGGRLGLSVTQYVGPRPSEHGRSSWDQAAATQVHGLAAELRLGRTGNLSDRAQYVRQLRWTENGVSITVSSGPAASPDRLLSAGEMLRIADGVHW